MFEDGLFPRLMVGEIARTARLQAVKALLPIHSLASLSEAREWVNDFSLSPPLDVPVFVEDISLLAPNVQNLFLKIVEDSSHKLVFLCAFDNFSSPFLSRFPVFEKSPLIMPVSNEKGLSALREAIEELPKDAHAIEVSKLVTRIHPPYVRLNSYLQNSKFRERMYQLLS